MPQLAFRFELEVDETLKKLFDSGAAELYRRFNVYYRDKVASRYVFASQVTRYAKSSAGTRQKRSQRIRGESPPGGALFGIDSGDLFKDTTQRLKISQQGAIEVYSDKVYAATIFALFEAKGPFEEGLFQVDEDDLNYLDNEIYNLIESELEN